MQFFGGSVAAEMSPSPAAPPGTTSGNNANMLYLFNRNGVCLLYREWHRPLHTLDPNQDQKLMFGLLFSLRSFTAKMDPISVDKGNLGAPLLPGQGCSFYSFQTNTYKLSFMESPSGIKIILVTHQKTGDLRASLRHIYSLYVEYVVKNPLYIPGTPTKWTQGANKFKAYNATNMISESQVASKVMRLSHMCRVATQLACMAHHSDEGYKIVIEAIREAAKRVSEIEPEQEIAMGYCEDGNTPEATKHSQCSLLNPNISRRVEKRMRLRV